MNQYIIGNSVFTAETRRRGDAEKTEAKARFESAEEAEILSPDRRDYRWIRYMIQLPAAIAAIDAKNR